MGRPRHSAPQTEREARNLPEDAREATEQLWKETERARAAVQGETRRLEDLRRRTHEQLGRMHGHLESVLEEIRLGIDDAHDVNEEQSEPEPAETLTPTSRPLAGGRPAQPQGCVLRPLCAGDAREQPQSN